VLRHVLRLSLRRRVTIGKWLWLCGVRGNEKEAPHDAAWVFAFWRFFIGLFVFSLFLCIFEFN
jgi:hypothetical protein